MGLRHYLVLEMAAFLAWNSAPAPATVLGVVAAANRGHLNTSAVSAGTTVYDGDRFSTETGGMLLLRGDATMLELGEGSEVIVRSRANGAQGTEVELDRGTLAFSAARADALEIVAWQARIRPATEARTMGQVGVIGPRDLRVDARRGSLQFSYRGETEVIGEGESFRLLLDPADDDSKKKEPVKNHRKHKTFLLIAVGGAGAGAAVAIHENQNHGHKKVESPDRP